MKTIRAIALLAFSLLAVCGEAATGWPSGGGSLYLPVLADHFVAFNVNVTGLGDSPAKLYITMMGADGPYEHEFVTEFLGSPDDGGWASFNINDGNVAFSERYVPSEFNDVNNLYLEIFVDANHYMLARLGEDPNLSITLNHLEYDPEFPDEPLYYYYDVNATVEFKDGYIAPFHEGPDPLPTPEPTSGLMLLLGVGALALRRRK